MRDVTIIGAGPIGLLLGNILGSKGINTLILDKKGGIDSRSRAIGITPPSLKIINSVDLKDEFINRGVRIDDVKIHGKNQSNLGGINFKNIDSSTPFILSLPQQDTEEILLESLKRYPSVEIMFNTEVTSLSQISKHEPQSIDPPIINQENMGHVITAHWENWQELNITSKIVCGCDGFRSTIREQCGLIPKGKKYKKTFLMGDFVDKTGWGEQARLFFTPIGSVESFPMPEGKRRWVIQTKEFMKEPKGEFLVDRINERAKMDLTIDDNISVSPFSVYRYLLPRFYDNGIIFLGDAAHTISPIGGQGMNSGFGDAEFAAMVVERTLEKGWNPKLLNLYSNCRKKAAEAAADRAQLSMGIGTIGGEVASAWRNFWLKLALSSPIRNVLPKHYAMLTIPFHSLDSKRTKKILKRIDFF